MKTVIKIIEISVARRSSIFKTSFNRFDQFLRRNVFQRWSNSMLIISYVVSIWASRGNSGGHNFQPIILPVCTKVKTAIFALFRIFKTNMGAFITTRDKYGLFCTPMLKIKHYTILRRLRLNFGVHVRTYVLL